MSKKKKSKKKNNAVKTVKKKSKKPMIIALCAVAAAAAAIVAIALLNRPEEPPKFWDKQYSSTSAYDASGDEVELKKIYNNERYPNYQGSMSLKSDGTFSFWMGVGDPSDGTHKGTYTYDRASETVSATFDNGETAEFKVIKDSEGNIDHIEAPYGEYKIWFEDSEKAAQ